MQLRTRAAAIAAALSIGLVAPLARAEWDTYQADDGHTGYVSSNVDFSDSRLLWSRSLSTAGLTNLAVGNGEVFVSASGYFGDNSGAFALSQSTGQTIWQKTYLSTNISGQDVFSVNAPAYSNGIVYVQTSDNGGDTYLHAYNASTGATTFTAPFGSQWEHYLNPTVYQGTVYIDGGTYGGMYAFNGNSGTQSWYGYVPQYDGWTPAVDANYCYSFTGSGDTTPLSGVFTMINRATGTTAYTLSVPNYPLGSYTMNSAVVLGSNHDAFSIINGGTAYFDTPEGGRLIDWDTDTSNGQTPHIAWTMTDGFSGQPTLANGVLYTIDDGHLSARDETDGNELWSWTGSSSLDTTMIATPNDVFVGDGSDTYAINLLSHQVDWQTPVVGNIALSDNILYIATATGSIYAYAVPEPARLSMAFVASIALLGRRRRTACRQ